MIQSNKQLYQEIIKIINSLKHANEAGHVNELQNALSISTVTSEILGELRIILQDLNNGNFVVDKNIKKQIYDSLSYINSIL